MKFRKRPVVIEATQFFRKSLPWPTGVKVSVGPAGRKRDEYMIDTLEGPHIVSEGDWIITGVKGELYPCKPDIFNMTYSPIGDEETDDTELHQWQRYAAYCRCCALGGEDSVMDFDAFLEKEGIAGV